MINGANLFLDRKKAIRRISCFLPILMAKKCVYSINLVLDLWSINQSLSYLFKQVRLLGSEMNRAMWKEIFEACADSKGTDQPALMRRLIWAFAVRFEAELICRRTANAQMERAMCRLIWKFTIYVPNHFVWHGSNKDLSKKYSSHAMGRGFDLYVDNQVPD